MACFVQISNSRQSHRCWAGKVSCDPALEGEPCGDDLGLETQTTQTATVMAGSMDGSYRYLYQCLIAREPLFDGNGNLQEGRVGIASAIVNAVNSAVMRVDISGAAAGGAVNANDPLVLDCSSTTPTSTSTSLMPTSTPLSSTADTVFVWELTAGDLPGGDSLSEVALSVDGFSSAGQGKLVLSANSFTPGQEIELTCSVVSGDGELSGQARLPLFVRPSPAA
eukprot:scaffold3148_cov36-Prasinocladus_malaysianus.AAC.1